MKKLQADLVRCNSIFGNYPMLGNLLGGLVVGSRRVVLLRWYGFAGVSK